MSLLTIPRPLYQRLLDHCREEWPREAVGVLLGRDGRVERGYALPNVHPDPERHFALDPVDQEEALRPVAAGQCEFLALYHSHPRTVAVPSPRDLAGAAGAGYLLIISLAQEPPDVRAYRIDRGQPLPVPHRKGDGMAWEWIDLR
ncbi:MAG: M67 family metallopeptidase [Bacillota bacterium]|nr:MAG: hypothetical protein DIU70_11665 [Bacillota bacterium]